jgi:electron transfer flavoprotein alpha subunit
MTEAKKPKRPRGVARLIPGKCIACGARCQASCPKEAVEMNEAGEPIILTENCIGCRKCIKVCPADAIEIYYTPEEQKILDELAEQAEKAKAPEPEEELSEEEARVLAKIREYRGVWVFVEQTGSLLGIAWHRCRAGQNPGRGAVRPGHRQ